MINGGNNRVSNAYIMQGTASVLVRVGWLVVYGK